MSKVPKFDGTKPHKAGQRPVSLPAGGREGDPPPWPSRPEPDAAEVAAWDELWHSPQSVVWERFHIVRVVARYARLLVRSERRDSSPALHAQVTALEDRLGMSPKAMRMLLWSVDEATDAEVRPLTRPADVRRRIRAVEDDR